VAHVRLFLLVIANTGREIVPGVVSDKLLPWCDLDYYADLTPEN